MTSLVLKWTISPCLTQILRGKEDSLTGFLDPMNFGDSLWVSAVLYILHLHSPYILTLALEKLFHPSFSLIFSNLSCCTFSLSLSRVYEEHILATGSLDERIFTGEGASEEIGTPGPWLCEGLENQNSAISRLHVSLTVRQQTCVFMFTVSHLFLIFLITPSLYGHQASALKVATPLTGRKYIQENVVASPISTAMNSVGRLHTLLSGTQQGPSAKLAETFGCVPQNYFPLEAGRVRLCSVLA